MFYIKKDFIEDYILSFYIALGALGLLYVLNVLSFIQAIILCYDKRFSQWRDSSAMNKCFNGFGNIISMSISHKFRNILFCRLFAFHVFSAMVDDLRRFKIFNMFSFISLISSGAAIFSAFMVIDKPTSKTQFYYACLDVIIVHVINIIFSFFNAQKPSDFFDEQTPEGFLLNKKMYGDSDLIEGKVAIAGLDIENEEGQGYYSKIQHSLGSNQAFRFDHKEDDIVGRNRIDLDSNYDSMTNIVNEEDESSVR